MSAQTNANFPVVNTHLGDAQDVQYLMFQLSGETFAISISHIKEILEYNDVTEMPMMPDIIQGVINLRGRVVPVVNLQARFGKPGSEINKRTCIVIIEVDNNGETHDFGIVVDSVSEVIDIHAKDIEPSPSLGARIRTDFIYGMGKIEGKFVIILNINRVLSLEDLNLINSVAATA